MAKNPDRHRFPHRIWFYCLIIFLLMGTGCAKKPWTDPLGENQEKEAKKVLDSMQERDGSCPSCLDGDAVVAVENHLETRVLSGYVKLMLPDSVKFIASNPLGQPLFAVATDGVKFESLNTSNRTYMAGSLRSYALLHDIAPAFLSGSWAEWLTGRIDSGKKDALALQMDGDARGVWFSFKQKAGDQTTTSRLLIDTAKGLLLSRIIEDGKGKILAEISYTDWQKVDGCLQPGQIRMSRLSFGGQLSLKLSNVEASELCRERDFMLPVPGGYQRQLIP